MLFLVTKHHGDVYKVTQIEILGHWEYGEVAVFREKSDALTYASTLNYALATPLSKAAEL